MKGKGRLTARQVDALAIFVEHTSVDVLAPPPYSEGALSLDVRSVLALWRKGFVMPIPSAPCEFVILREGIDAYLEATREVAS